MSVKEQITYLLSHPKKKYEEEERICSLTLRVSADSKQKKMRSDCNISTCLNTWLHRSYIAHNNHNNKPKFKGRILKVVVNKHFPLKMSTNYSQTMLTSGALSVIMNEGSINEPIMQIVGCRKIVNKGTEKTRYRLMVSDGEHLCSFVFLTTELTNNILSGDFPIDRQNTNDVNEILPKYSIIKIKEYSVDVIPETIDSDMGNTIRGRKLLIILDFEVLASSKQVGKILGNPVALPNNISTSLAQDIENNLDVKRPNSDSETSTSKRQALSNNPAIQAPLEIASSSKRPSLSNKNANRSTDEVNLNMSINEEVTHPISSLTPYSPKWLIKARVVSKSSICTFSNGTGKYFKLDLIDESGQIRCTAFNELADKFYDSIQVDKVYYISNCRIKLENPNFKTSNDYELIFTNNSVVQETEVAGSVIPTIKFNFKRISAIANMNVGELIDVIGICKKHSDLRELTSKNGKNLKKRELLLLDLSKTCITLTLWGSNAENYNHKLPIVAVKGARVCQFGGKINLSMPDLGIIKYNPDLNEAKAIRTWFESGGDKEEALNISASNSNDSFETNWLGFKEAKLLDLDGGGKANYYKTMGTILQLSSDKTFYKGCPSVNCNKKVIALDNGEYSCEKCNSVYPNFKYKLMARMNVGDWSGSQWLTVFSSEAERLFGKTAREIGETSERDEEEFLGIINNANLKQFIFKCRVKTEIYNEEPRLQTVAIHVEPINYKEYNSHLISQLQQITGCIDK